MTLSHPQLQLMATALPAPPMVNQEVLLNERETITGEGTRLVFLVVVQWLFLTWWLSYVLWLSLQWPEVRHGVGSQICSSRGSLTKVGNV